MYVCTVHVLQLYTSPNMNIPGPHIHMSVSVPHMRREACGAGPIIHGRPHRVHDVYLRCSVFGS